VSALPKKVKAMRRRTDADGLAAGIFALLPESRGGGLAEEQRPGRVRNCSTGAFDGVRD
jgi:hypothetical protein